MIWLRTLLARLPGLLHRSPAEAELSEELEAHRAMLIEDGIRRGLAADEARRQAHLALGNKLAIREAVREQAGIPTLESVWQDAHYGARMLRKSPAVTAVIVLSLALGIGANTAIFSLMNAVILRLLPVEKPEQLVALLRQYPGRRATNGFTNALWEALRDQQNVFAGTFAYSPPLRFDLAQGGSVRNVNGLFVSGDFFNTLGIIPAAGRLVAASDDQRGCAPIAVLSYQFWQAHFGGAKNALGSTINLNRQPFQVIGVSPAGFFGVEVGKDFDVAVPLCASALFDKRNIESRSRWFLNIVGRVKPGITRAQLKARLDVLAPSVLRAALPQDWEVPDQQRFLKMRLLAIAAGTGSSQLRQTFRVPLEILMAIVALVLLIACANIASLLLARATTRGKEIAIRKALGASRNRLMRQLLTESLLLALLGAGLGVLFARWGSAMLARSLSTSRNPIFLDLSLDRRVLGFAVAVAVLTGILVGLLPALRSSSVGLIEAMKTRTAVGSEQRSRFHAGKWIVAGQLALSLVLLIGGGLLLRTFVKLLMLDLGFDRNNVMVVTARPPWFAGDRAKVPKEQHASTYNEIVLRLRSLPGVISAARAFTSPIGDDNWLQVMHSDVPNAPTGEQATIYLNFVGPGYLGALRIPLLAGRDFNEQDTTNSPLVAIVNETAARKFFSGVNALGHHFRWGQEPGQVEVIGLVKDSKYETVREVTPPTIFLPASQVPPRAAAEEFVLRTSLPPAALISAVQHTVAKVNESIPLEFHTLAEQVDDNMVQERLLAALAGFFGVLGLLLAMIGLYGVLSYLVTQRQVEFGIRMALGAQPISILRLVLRDVALVLASGITTGLLISMASTGLLQKMLFGLQPRDTVTMVAAVCLLSGIALVAACLPARRASRVDPMVALKYE